MADNAPAQGGRRRFIKQIAGTAAVAVSTSRASLGAEKTQDSKPATNPDSNQAAALAHSEHEAPLPLPGLTTRYSGSDFMVDVIKTLGLQYLASCPGDSFRGLQESLIHYGANKSPEWLTCTHEAISVGIALGYSKASQGRPMAAMMKSGVGVQNAVMEVYNAFADRAPMILFSSTEIDGAERKIWGHTAQDNNAVLRDMTKWDDTPGSLQHFADSLMRAYKITTTPPAGPVMLSVDSAMQEAPLEDRSHLKVPRLTQVRYPVADTAAIKALAEKLVAAEFPVISADRYARTWGAMPALVELAELLGAAVIDRGTCFNFPTDHPLNQTFSAGQSLARTDFLLALEPVNLWRLMHVTREQLVRTTRPVLNENAKIVTLGIDSPIRSNYQEFGRYVGVHEHIGGEAETSLPILIEEVRSKLSPSAKRRAADRRKVLEKQFAERVKRDREQAALAWNASPITTARLSMELLNAVKDVDWVISSPNWTTSHWPQRLWPMNEPHRNCAAFGAGGLGDGMAKAIGAALAHREHGRIVVNIQPDGDLMFTPGALWTAAHHRMPVLTVVHNNRAYHQEVMELQVIANRRERNVEGERIGCTLTNPEIDFAQVARGMGVWAEGPISAPDQLEGALARAMDVVKNGNPALVDVVSEPR